jgi:hypothetical protein
MPFSRPPAVRIPWRRGSCVAFLLGLLVWPGRLWCATLPAAGAPMVSLHTQAGWAGWIPQEAWLPVQVDLQVSASLDGVLIVDVPVPGYAAPLSFRRSVRLGAGARQRLIVDIFVPDARRTLTVRLLASGQQVARQYLPLSAARAVESVVLALTRDAAGLEVLADSAHKIKPAYVTEHDLPAQWQGYAGVRLLVIRDLNTYAVSPAQQQALEQWVLQGGRLAVAGGERLVLLRAPWLLKMLPAVPQDLTSVQHLDMSPSVRGPISVTTLVLRSGATGGPLRARWRWGAGSVLVWAFDPFAPELRASRPALWAEALDAPVRPWIASPDLASVLPASRPLSGTVRGALLILSVVYIGSVRYALGRAGRTRTSWLSVPAVALVFTTAMYGFGLHIRHTGTSAVQVSVIEVLPGTDMARVRTSVALLNPYESTFQWRAPDDSWVQPVEPRPLTFDGPSAISASALLSGLRVDATQVVPMPLQGRAVSDEAGLRAEVDNRSGVAITDAQIFRSGQVYRLARLGAKFSTVLDPARWEPFRRQPNPPATLHERAIEDVLVRLQQQRATPDTVAWLVGRLEDGRLVLAGRPMAVEAHQVVVVPLQSAGAMP